MKSFSYPILFTLLVGCSPRILYLGERYPSSQQSVEIFFDESQINRPYQVIGSLVNAGRVGYSNHERIQRAIIEEATAVGADAIVFNDIDVEMTSDGGSTILKAKAIRY